MSNAVTFYMSQGSKRPCSPVFKLPPIAVLSDIDSTAAEPSNKRVRFENFDSDDELDDQVDELRDDDTNMYNFTGEPQYVILFLSFDISF